SSSPASANSAPTSSNITNTLSFRGVPRLFIATSEESAFGLGNCAGKHEVCRSQCLHGRVRTPLLRGGILWNAACLERSRRAARRRFASAYLRASSCLDRHQSHTHRC